MSLAQQAGETIHTYADAQHHFLNTYLDIAQRLHPWTATKEFWTYWQQINERCFQIGETQLRTWLTAQSLWTRSWLTILNPLSAFPTFAKHWTEHTQQLVEEGMHSLEETSRDAAQVQENLVQEGQEVLDQTRDLQKQIAEAVYLKAEKQGLVPGPEQEAQAALDQKRDLQKQIAEAVYLKAEEQGLVPSLAQEAQAALDQTRDLQTQIAERAYLKAEERGFVPGHEQQDWAEAEREVRNQD